MSARSSKVSYARIFYSSASLHRKMVTGVTHTKKHKENLKEKKFRLKIIPLIEDFDQFLKEESDICI